MTAESLRAQEYLLYLPDHRVLICRSCKHVIRPTRMGIGRHLLNMHKTLGKELRTALAKYANGFDLLPLEEVLHPMFGCQPIEGLSVSRGWNCRECRHACIAEDSMEEHCKVEHKWVIRLGKRWDSCKVQTFFVSNKRKYFVVADLTDDDATDDDATDDGMSDDDVTDSERMSGSIDHFIDAILKDAENKDVEENEQLGLVDINQHMVDKSPWMRRTGWLWEFAGKDMGAIVKKSWRPTKEEQGLQLIWRSIGRVLDTCVDGVTDCVERNWRLISFWLNGSEAGKADSKPFNIDNDQMTIK